MLKIVALSLTKLFSYDFILIELFTSVSTLEKARLYIDTLIIA